MSRTGRVIALLLAAGFVAAVATGRGRLFVRPWFLPGLVAAGALLLVAAWRGRAPMGRPAAAVLLLPLVAGIGLTPDLVGDIESRGAFDAVLSRRLGEAENPLLAGDGGVVTVLDVALAEQQVGAVFLAGREVSVEGRVDADHAISRLAMVCCAADARSVRVMVVGALPAAGTWVRVSGTLGVSEGRVTIEAERVTRIETPEGPFL
ncbi:MAG TPA: hypothetical protein VGB51_05115 [Actinomycetota bacterium]